MELRFFTKKAEALDNICEILMSAMRAPRQKLTLDDVEWDHDLVRARVWGTCTCMYMCMYINMCMYYVHVCAYVCVYGTRTCICMWYVHVHMQRIF